MSELEQTQGLFRRSNVSSIPAVADLPERRMQGRFFACGLILATVPQIGPLQRPGKVQVPPKLGNSASPSQPTTASARIRCAVAQTRHRQDTALSGSVCDLTVAGPGLGLDASLSRLRTLLLVTSQKCGFGECKLTRSAPVISSGSIPVTTFETGAYCQSLR
jgi:hypothetical protein